MWWRCGGYSQKKRFVFYGCVTSYHKLRKLKQCKFTISQFLWIRTLPQHGWVLWSGSPTAEIKETLKDAILTWGLGTKLILVMDRIQFPVGLGLRSPLSYLLLTRGHSLLESTFFATWPSIFKLRKAEYLACEIPLRCWISLPLPLTARPGFKGHQWLGQACPERSSYFKVYWFRILITFVKSFRAVSRLVLDWITGRCVYIRAKESRGIILEFCLPQPHQLVIHTGHL